MINAIITRIRAWFRRIRRCDCTDNIVGGLTKTVTKLDNLSTEKFIEAENSRLLARTEAFRAAAASSEAMKADRVARNINNLLNG